MTHSFERLKVGVGEEVHLATVNAAATTGWSGGKRKAERALPALRDELGKFQEMFYASEQRGLLVIFQGMDTSGKDGAIRHVFEGVNPQGVRVTSFKVPTLEESAHDFLWRVHRATPARGEIMIFNRSQYEDVLVARVHDLVPERVWSRRFDSINAFEKELTEEGVLIVKFLFHISREEQARRLEDRIKDPTKQWKLTLADFHERRFWKKYIAAYEDVLRRTSTPWAPWYLVPSNHKWYRNLVVSTVLVEELRAMKLRYPRPTVPVATFRFR